MRWQINFPKLEIRLKLVFFLCMPSARPLYARSSSCRFVWFVNCLASNFATSTLNSLFCWTPFLPLCSAVWSGFDNTRFFIYAIFSSPSHLMWFCLIHITSITGWDLICAKRIQPKSRHTLHTQLVRRLGVWERQRQTMLIITVIINVYENGNERCINLCRC